MKKTILMILILVLIILIYFSSNLFSEPSSDSSSSSLVTDDNLLKNGDFSNGTNQWVLWEDKGQASMVIENGEAKIKITNPGPHLWSIGLSQRGFSIENGETYTLTFQARASTTREIYSVIQMPHDPWTSYSGGNSFILTNSMAKFSYTFTMYYSTDNASDFQIFIGEKGVGTIYIDNVILKKVGSSVPEVNYPIIKPSVDRSNIIIYEIVPGSYNGGTWNGGKCIKGITSRLDKIKELGINCIWLTPVFEGEGLGYWTFDYYKISTKFGTLDDMKELVYESHKRNIMIILDLVLNYTWKQHPFFQDVLKNKGLSPYKDYYIWKGKPGESDYDYYFDWIDVPNLNLANQEVREYLYDVSTYWVNKLDIDGYRVDCAWALEDRYPGFSAEMKKRLVAIKPDIFLLAEGNVNEGRFFNNGYNSAYDWDLRGFGDLKGFGLNVFPYLFDGSITPQKLHTVLTRDLPVNGLPFRFTENHDHPRAASLWGVNGSKVAHTIVLTSKGYPDIFGGAEVGFAPSLSNKYSQDDPVLWDYNSPIYEYFKKIIAIRNQYLKSDLKQYWITNNSIVIYSSLSVSGTNKLIILANCRKSKASVILNLSNPELGTINELTELISGTNVTYDGKGSLKVTLEGYETKIIVVK